MSEIIYRHIEAMLFHTCNYRCAYCGFVTGGTVGYAADLEPYRDLAYIDGILKFFRTHSSRTEKWKVLFSGGEPFLTPNLPYLAQGLIEDGHKLRYNTNLSVPIEKNPEWLAANPPSGVDLIMASLHPESLEKRELIYERIKCLKSLGYRVVARVVAHPLLIDEIETIDKEVSQLGVGFNVIPMFSPNYPKAYTDDQKTRIKKSTRTFAHLIQLEGGLDTAGRICHAGSKLFALALGKTGGGNLYRCVSCHDTALMGNIFRDETIAFRDRPTSCCHKSKHCTCSFHFESGAVVGAEDDVKYEALGNGGAAPVTDSEFDLFVQKGGLRFKHADEAPQGTFVGEKMLIYTPDSALRELLGPDTIEVFRADEKSALHKYKEGVNLDIHDGNVIVTCLGPNGGGVFFSFQAKHRERMVVQFEGFVHRGNASLAVYLGSDPQFWHLIPKFKGRKVVTESFIPKEGTDVVIYLYSDEPVIFEFQFLSILQKNEK